jgi:hypothetical protein
MLILTRCVRKNVKILKVLITITNIIVPLEPGRWSGGANLLGEAKRVGGMPWPPAPASEGEAGGTAGLGGRGVRQPEVAQDGQCSSRVTCRRRKV